MEQPQARTLVRKKKSGFGRVILWIIVVVLAIVTLNYYFKECPPSQTGTQEQTGGKNVTVSVLSVTVGCSAPCCDCSKPVAAKKERKSLKKQKPKKAKPKPAPAPAPVVVAVPPKPERDLYAGVDRNFNRSAIIPNPEKVEPAKEILVFLPPPPPDPCAGYFGRTGTGPCGDYRFPVYFGSSYSTVHHHRSHHVNPPPPPPSPPTGHPPVGNTGGAQVGSGHPPVGNTGGAQVGGGNLAGGNTGGHLAGGNTGR